MQAAMHHRLPMLTPGFVWAAFVVAGAAIATCVTMPVSVPDGSIACPAGQIAFNGACRSSCAHTSDCPSGQTCNSVPGGAVCLESSNCAYLGSDTECVGFGRYTVFARFGAETHPYVSEPADADPSMVTPYRDPSFTPTAADPYLSDLGCQGNATFTTVAPSTDPACGQTHAVTRCRRLYVTCQLVPGSTVDQPAP